MDIKKGSLEHRRAVALAKRKPPLKNNLLKYFFIVRRRHFPQRLLNYVLCKLDSGKKAVLRYYPIRASLEPNSRCNLSCPDCPTGDKSKEFRTRGKASFEIMRHFIDKVAPRAVSIALLNWGEPLLSRDFYLLCRYAVDLGLWTGSSSNLSFPLQGRAEKLVKARLGHLLVSVSGATQQTHTRYHVGGDIELVLGNLGKIAEEKKRLGCSYPIVTAKYLVFDYNVHEIEAFDKRAREAGVNDVVYVPGGRGYTLDTMFNLEKLQYEPKADLTTPGPCPLLWEMVYSDFDGSIFPCCYAFKEKDVIIDAKEAQARSLDDIWNGPQLVGARNYFLGGSFDQLPVVCKDCVVVEEYKKSQTGPQ